MQRSVQRVPNFVRNRETAFLLEKMSVALIIYASLCGCVSQKISTEALSKGLEEQAYAEITEVFSTYCARISRSGKVGEDTTIEMFREIRQHGNYGPSGPSTEIVGRIQAEGDTRGIDPKTLYGGGPVVLVFCNKTTVPASIFTELEKYWSY